MIDDDGSVLPLAVGLMLVSLIVTALVVDIALLHAAYRATASIADSAAESGAAMIDPARAHDGEFLLAPEAAERTAETVARGIGNPKVVSAAATTTEVCVTVTHDHHTFALAVVGARSVAVRVTSCAVPAVG